jgi:ketosteroid isomerase-like protein
VTAGAVRSRERRLEDMLAKDAIYDLLCRYCHGIDRCDAETLKSAYWPDATETHGTFDGNAWEFADFMTDNMRRNMLRSMQKIGNAWIIIDDDGIHGRGETYVTGYMDVPAEDGGVAEMTVGGRYLDRYEKRGEEWRIIDRVYVMDWNRNGPSTAEWERGIYDMLRTRGGRTPDDPWDQGVPRPRWKEGA